MAEPPSSCQAAEHQEMPSISMGNCDFAAKAGQPLSTWRNMNQKTKISTVNSLLQSNGNSFGDFLCKTCGACKRTPLMGKAHVLMKCGYIKDFAPY